MSTRSTPNTLVRIPSFHSGSNISAKTYEGLFEKFQNLTTPEPNYYQDRYAGGGTISSGRGRQHFNTCDHVHSNMIAHPEDGKRMFINEWSGTFYGYVRYYADLFPPMYAPTPPNAVYSELLRDQAWAAMQPQIDNGFSLLNFLFELRDFKSLFQSVSRIGWYFANAPWRKRQTGKKTLADLALTYSFAVAPLYSDLCSLAEKIGNVDKELNEFIARGKKANNYHFRKDVSSAKRNTIGTCGHVEITDKVTYHATARMRYEYTKPQGLEAVARVFGLHPTPERIWNAIPWTFLVDWVIKIGDFLKQFENDPNLEVHILDFCESLKCESQYKYKCGNPCSYGSYYTLGPGFGDDVLWEANYIHYNRQLSKPSGFAALPALDSLSMRELVLSWALTQR